METENKYTNLYCTKCSKKISEDDIIDKNK